MDILNGIKNFLQFINDNWSVIIIIIGLGIALYQRIQNYISKSNEEKIEIAKVQIKEFVLKWITDAEIDYLEWTSAGSIKRSQVMKQIFEMFPILSKATNQEELIAWIDDVIDEALKTMREIFEKNTEKSIECENK